MELAEGAQRHDHLVVFGILASAEHRFYRRDRADYREELALNVDFLSQWILVAEQLLGSFRPQQHDRRVVLLIDLAEPAPSGNLQVKDFFGRRFIAFENGVLGFVVAILHGERSYAQFRAEITHARGDGLHMRQLRNGARILVRELFPGAHLFGGTPEGKRLYVKSEDHVGANACHDGLNVVVQPATNGGNTDHHGDANHNPQHGQRRAQLVAADGGRRHVQDLGDFAFTHWVIW